MSALVRGVTSGAAPVVARYYTLVPYEDDSRQRAFLDAVARAGLSVIVKRLPPKGITRQVSVDLEMAADMVAFAHGLTSFSKENEYMPADAPLRAAAIHTPAQYVRRQQAEEAETADTKEQTQGEAIPDIKTAPRSIVVVCPSRELAYPLSLVKDIAADTTSADFGQFNTGDILKSAQKWIDLSDSETIWRD
jgi:uncharacterized protein YeaO (DUF488 family)